jgi:uncharacterized protein (TIGR02453 family)
MAAAKVVAYFGEEFLDFFSALSRNNKREWFHAHKKRYEQHVKKPFEAFVGEMIHRIGSVDPAIAIQPREAIFRIARDTRFSKDKTPYKTFVAAAISPGGRRDMQYPGLYFQFGAAGGLIAGGLHQLDKDNVFKVRQAILRHGATLDRALQGKRFRESFGELHGERHKRLPKQFAAFADRYPYIANKQFYYYVEYDDPRFVLRADLAEVLMRHYRAAGPVNEFLRKALQEV